MCFLVLCICFMAKSNCYPYYSERVEHIKLDEWYTVSSGRKKGRLPFASVTNIIIKVPHSQVAIRTLVTSHESFEYNNAAGMRCSITYMAYKGEELPQSRQYNEGSSIPSSNYNPGHALRKFRIQYTKLEWGIRWINMQRRGVASVTNTIEVPQQRIAITALVTSWEFWIHDQARMRYTSWQTYVGEELLAALMNT